MKRSAEEPEGLGQDDPHADPVSVAREIVLRQLTFRARTRGELEAALSKRNVPDDVARQVLDRFTELRLIDDGAFAEAWVSGQQRRMTSRRVLRQELVRKGVADEVIEGALDVVDDDDELAAAMALAEKKARTLAGLEPHVAYRRIAGALARKGFSGSVTHRATRHALAAR